MEYMYNDGGRSTAGYKGYTGDCGVRAIAIAASLPYKEVYNTFIKLCAEEKPSKSRKGMSHPRTGIHTHTFKRYVEDILGWKWVSCSAIGVGCTVHMDANELPHGRIIVRLSKHYAAVIDGILHDTYEDTRNGTRCVYGYWIKE